MEPDAPPALSISLLEDGFPRLPDIEVDGISPKDAKRLVSDYLSMAWGMLISSLYLLSNKVLTNIMV